MINDLLQDTFSFARDVKTIWVYIKLQRGDADIEVKRWMKQNEATLNISCTQFNQNGGRRSVSQDTS